MVTTNGWLLDATVHYCKSFAAAANVRKVRCGAALPKITGFRQKLGRSDCEGAIFVCRSPLLTVWSPHRFFVAIDKSDLQSPSGRRIAKRVIVRFGV
ncbi:hypothetical protein CGZ80_14375 [Rhodopirellula sp. MGV]|nr:hypothetical protein CGZ80_14375 [Rhodopirellula sp. MGV]PNY36713.1 hypothetical protein C2E31_11380 [Rhodopirellula baltica]